MKLPGLRYDSPNTFTRKQRFVLRVAPPLVAAVLKALSATCRLEVRGEQHLREARAHGPVLLAIWHEILGLGACHFRNTNYHTLTSYSFDGELAARIVARFGIGAVRGSSSRGGSEGLRDLERAVKLVDAVGFTLDGPRGPRREAKPGISILAARTQAPIVPLAYAVSRAWRMRSWDRLAVPKPFARILCGMGPAIAPPADGTPEAVEAHRQQVERELNALHATLESEVSPDIFPGPGGD